MKEIAEDLRTDQEKRQDAFVDFLKCAEDGDMASINFCGNKISVRFSSRNGNFVSLNYLGKRTDIPAALGFNISTLDETELLRKI